MKCIVFTFCIAILALTSIRTFASCVGGPTLQTCTDGSGNSYTVNRMGNTTTVNGQYRRQHDDD
jgi:hypothetical protein